MPNFILPGMYEHYKLNFQLLNILNEHPEYFHDNLQITATYGNFQFCVWDGGRNFSNYRQTTKEEIEYITSVYNETFNVPIRLVFTNTQLTPKDYHNRFGNMVLSTCENDGINEIVVNDDNFRAWIKERYPGYSFISSTTKCLSSPDAFKEELVKEDYKMICLDYNLNKNWKLLDSIPENLRSKCEFLINAICPAGCQQRKEHYKYNSLFSLSYGQGYSMENCLIRDNTLSPSMCASRNNLSPEEIYTKYIPKGFDLWKIEGRTLSTIENACNYVKYMVKPEYQFYVLTLLLPDDAHKKLYI